MSLSCQLMTVGIWFLFLFYSNNWLQVAYSVYIQIERKKMLHGLSDKSLVEIGYIFEMLVF